MKQKYLEKSDGIGTRNKGLTSGITLIALVVTIIVLLILAGVSINMLLGENGIITKAKEAKVESDKAVAKESVQIEVLGSYNGNGTLSIESLKENLGKIGTVTSGDSFPVKVIVNGYELTVTEKGKVTIEGEATEEDEEEDYSILADKKGVWLGDSLIRGYGNYDENGDWKGFPEYYADLVGAEVNLNYAFTGATISNNTPNDTNQYLRIAEQVNYLVADKTTYEEMDFIALDGGGNDVIGYYTGAVDSSYKKEIGTVGTTEDSVIKDFEEILSTIKENFPNAKVLYVQAWAHSQSDIENLVFRFVTNGKTTDELESWLESLSWYSGPYETIEDSKSDIIKLYTEGASELGASAIIPDMVERAEELFTEIEKAMNKYGYEYVDISGDITATGEKYQQSDTLHLTDEGYTLLTPKIASKLKEMFE